MGKRNDPIILVAIGLSDPTRRREHECPKLTEATLKKYLITAALVVSFSAPAWAVETYYIMFDNTMKGKPGACSIMTSRPTDQRYKTMGHYSSQSAAETAMHSMKKCT
jgi:hypothetical protein